MRTTPKTKLCDKKREETLAREAKAGFFKVPYGATVCNCGNKIIAQGRCQTCYDKFVRGVRIERVRMHQEKKAEKAEHKKQWKLF